jgi:hypothetical protein
MRYVIFVLSLIVIVANAWSFISPSGNAECLLCNYVVGEAELLLSNNQTVNEIKIELMKGCNIFGKYSELCDEYINGTLPRIITYLEGQYSPTEICDMIHYCPTDCSAGTVEIYHLEDVDYCQLCEMVVDEIELQLQNNQTIAMLENKVLDFCEAVPEYSTECVELVDDYFYIFVEAIDNWMIKEQICEKIKLCGTN